MSTPFFVDKYQYYENNISKSDYTSNIGGGYPLSMFVDKLQKQNENEKTITGGKIDGGERFRNLAVPFGLVLDNKQQKDIFQKYKTTTSDVMKEQEHDRLFHSVSGGESSKKYSRKQSPKKPRFAKNITIRA